MKKTLILGLIMGAFSVNAVADGNSNSFSDLLNKVNTLTEQAAGTAGQIHQDALNVKKQEKEAKDKANNTENQLKETRNQLKSLKDLF